MRGTHVTAIAAVIGALLAATPAMAQQATDNVKSVDNVGMDGGQYLWQVRCKDGTRASIVLEDATSVLCAQPLNKPPRCAAATDQWSVRAAAAHACS